jgi:hypothetical protein
LTSSATPARPIGGSEDLPGRAVRALIACAEGTGALPTARRYQQWRTSLDPGQRERVPSLTAVVPIAYPSWGAARAAAGMPEQASAAGRHGPRPQWSEQACLDLVSRWLADPHGGGSLNAFSAWVDRRRADGEDVPSVSTVRLRLRRPWSGIVEAARGGSAIGAR